MSAKHTPGPWIVRNRGEITTVEDIANLLREELENIAHASMDDFVDYHEFKVWAQSRARHALESISQNEEGN